MMNPCHSLIVLLIAVMVSTLTGYADCQSPDYYTVPKYAYKYGVEDKVTGDFKRAYEVRDGDITRGSYSLLQPDGVIRTVEYTVDPIGGFRAQVINSGHGIHPRISRI